MVISRVSGRVHTGDIERKSPPRQRFPISPVHIPSLGSSIENHTPTLQMDASSAEGTPMHHVVDKRQAEVTVYIHSSVMSNLSGTLGSL